MIKKEINGSGTDGKINKEIFFMRKTNHVQLITCRISIPKIKNGFVLSQSHFGIQARRRRIELKWKILIRKFVNISHKYC